MVKARSTLSIAFALLLATLAGKNAPGQTTPPKANEFPLWKFDEMTAYPTCRAKGRLQDKGYCDFEADGPGHRARKGSNPRMVRKLDRREVALPRSSSLAIMS